MASKTACILRRNLVEKTERRSHLPDASLPKWAGMMKYLNRNVEIRCVCSDSGKNVVLKINKRLYSSIRIKKAASVA